MRILKKNCRREAGMIISNFPGSLVGGFNAFKTKILRKPFIFTDEAGFRFWQYPGDPIYYNHQRRNVCDSIGIRKYVIQNVHSGSICIDIGACIGSISVPLWKAVGLSGKVISIEADPENVIRTRNNIALNGFSESNVLHSAITDKEGYIYLRRFLGRNGWQTIGSPSFASGLPSELISVPSRTLRQIFENYALDTVELVKIDVEGAEHMVLKGMLPLLRYGKIEKVLFEVNHLMLEGVCSSVDNIISFWNDLPFSLYNVDTNGNIIPLLKNKWPEMLIGDCLAILKK